ncbi:hypothetical protein [Microseira wollei]|uniref:hypothetical protein n=1 Tax=Microseira wollei TaxID=467598 RepID=UPI001CFCA26D|nr:hypothetical protein [Microseira wollei]
MESRYLQSLKILALQASIFPRVGAGLTKYFVVTTIRPLQKTNSKTARVAYPTRVFAEVYWLVKPAPTDDFNSSKNQYFDQNQS